MNYDLHQILASKRAFRNTLATRPIMEKLAMLDELHARAITLRQAREAKPHSQILREEPSPYQTVRTLPDAKTDSPS
jgi:hypothetical protein